MCETPAVAQEPSIGPRWQRVLGAWWVVAFVVGAVFVLSPVRDATDNDPAFGPLTADALVHTRSPALDRFGAAALIGHPIVVTDGSLDPGAVVTAVGAPGWAQLEAAVADPDVDVVDYFPWPAALLSIPAVVATDAWSALTGAPDSAERLVAHDFVLPHTVSASLVSLGAVLVFRSIAMAVLRAPLRRRRLLANASALVVALGTSTWSIASRALWQHTPSLLVLSVALLCAVHIDRGRIVAGGRDSPTDDGATAEGAPTGSSSNGSSSNGSSSTRSGGFPVDAWIVGLGAAGVGAAVVRPTNLAFGAIIGIWVLVRRRDAFVATAVSAAAGALGSVLAFVGVSWVLVGTAIPAYYSVGRVDPGPWFFEAVAANWVSPSRGLLIASPVLLLAVPGSIVAWRRNATARTPARVSVTAVPAPAPVPVIATPAPGAAATAESTAEPSAGVSAGVSAGAVVAAACTPTRSLVVALWISVAAVTASVSAFPQWWAGHAFGPRFMTEAVPQLFLLTVPAVGVVFDPSRFAAGAIHRRRAVAAALIVAMLAVWSIGYHAIGSVFGASGCWSAYPVDIDSDPSRVWSVTDAQVLEPLHRALDPQRRAAQDAACVKG